MRGHVTGAAIGDRISNVIDRAAVQPDVVREIRRTEDLIALGVGAMTGGAQGRELRPPALNACAESCSSCALRPLSEST